MENFKEGSVLVALVTFLFFAGVAWQNLSDAAPAWLRWVVGVSAAVLAIASFIVLV